MKKDRLKTIAIAVAIISLSFPIIALKLKIPELKQDAVLNIPVEELVLKKREPVKYDIKNPFLVETKKLSSPVYGEITPEMIKLVYSGKDRFLIVNDEIVREGQFFYNFKVLRIYPDKIKIRDNKGVERWIKLPEHY